MTTYTVFGTEPSGREFTAPVEAESGYLAMLTFMAQVGDWEDFEVEGAR